jgi:maleylpyruvate isomerase
VVERSLERHLGGVVASHRGLTDMLDGLGGELDASAPSLLPGWTVGHVLTHIARNADSIVRVLDAAECGDVAERYPGGAPTRNAEIDAGSGRPAGEQVADVAASSQRLEAAWSRQTRWDGLSGEIDGREVTVASLVFARWREVEVHRADLGLGYGPEDWPAEYVREDLGVLEMRWNARRPMGMTGLPAAALQLPPNTRLAWLLGRLHVDGLEPAGVI